MHLSVTTLINKYYLQYLLTSSYIVPCSTILFDLLLYQLPIVQYCTVYILVVLLFPLYSVQLIPAVCLFTVPEVFKVPGEVLRLIVSTSSVVLPCVLHSTVTTPLKPAVLLCTSPALHTCRTPLYSAVVPATLPPHYCTSVIRAVFLSTGPAVPAILFSTTHAVFLSTTLAVHPALLSALSEVPAVLFSTTPAIPVVPQSTTPQVLHSLLNYFNIQIVHSTVRAVLLSTTPKLPAVLLSTTPKVPSVLLSTTPEVLAVLLSTTPEVPAVLLSTSPTVPAVLHYDEELSPVEAGGAGPQHVHYDNTQTLLLFFAKIF